MAIFTRITVPAVAHSRPRLGPVSMAVATMRAAHPERVALESLRNAILERIASDVARLERLEQIADGVRF
jgi:hypothetical protein